MLPTVTLMLSMVLLPVVAKPWNDKSLASIDYRLYPLALSPLFSPDDSYPVYDYPYDGDIGETAKAKRFSANSFRLFRPFYHNKSYQDSNGFIKRNNNSLDELIRRLLALKGNTNGGKVASMRFGPGGK